MCIRDRSHTAGAAKATATFSKVFAATNDFGADTFVHTDGVAGGSLPDTTGPILDGEGNPLARDPAAGPIVVRDVSVRLTRLDTTDTTPPGPVNSLNVVSTTSTMVTLDWFAPGDDGPTGTVSSYVVKYAESPITASTFDAATTAGTAGSTIVFNPSNLLAAGQKQAATISGLEPGKTYHFALKGVDDVGQVGPMSNVVSTTTEAPDTVAPAAITDLSIVTDTVKANSVKLSWTAPGDDGAAGGAVQSYKVKVSTSAITAANFDAADDATVVFEPATLAGPGVTQQATITGLAQNTEYFVAVVATDDAPNDGGLSNVVTLTTAEDTTPPTGTLLVTSPTHEEGVGVANGAPRFTFSGLSDPESTITYFFTLNKQETFTIVGNETDSNVGDGSHTYSNIPPGTWYFHIAGQSAGGISATTTYEIVVLEPVPVLTPQDLVDANEDLQATVDVARDGDDNVVTWQLPETDAPIAGVQVWRSTSPYSLLETLRAGEDAFENRTFRDTGAPATARYIVTVFFGDAEALGFFGQDDTLDDVPGYSDLSEDERRDLGKASVEDSDGDGFPWWGWLIIILVIIAIAALIFFLIKRSRDDEPHEEDVWDDDEPWAAPEDEGDVAYVPDEPAADGPAHDIECPQCDHTFTAYGHKPLKMQCPNCGVQGTLR